MTARRVKSRDGREWTITINRLRLPRWRHSNYDPGDDTYGFLDALFFYLVVAPVMWFVVPLLFLLVEFVIAVARAVFSETRWIYAVCTFPNEITIVWGRTTT